ncbi:MAG: permease-like cell division protein FtsX [Bacteroidota bacterium]
MKSKKIGQYPNFMVVISLTIALFLIGLCGLISFQAKRLATLVRQNIELQVYLDNDLSISKKDSIKKALSKKTFVSKNELDKANITFISKDSAAKEFIKDTKENFQTLLVDNPLRDAYLLKVKDEYFNESSLLKFKSEIEKIDGVYEVSYVENLVDDINKNIRKIYLILSGFVLLLLATIIVLVNNTIKLAVFSQRFLIRSMQLVGATNYFIQKPFVIRGALQGLTSAIIAIFLLVLLQQGAISKMPELLKLSDMMEFFILSIFIILLGVATGVVCTYSSIHKYLGLSLDELYS